MKTGRTLVELATELERQKNAKRDFVAPSMLLATQSNGHTDLNLGNGNLMPLSETAHEQLASKLDIPMKYYNRMRTSSPELLDKNINHWFGAQKDSFLLRTLDGKVRGVLSDKYRPMDNAELAEAALPKLMELDLEIMSCEVTEKRMFIKAVDKRMTKDIPSGKKMGDGSHTIFDTLCPAITISNSEIGYGSLSVLTGVFTKACTNLAMFGGLSVRKYHLGSKLGAGEETMELLSDRTRQLNDAALFSSIKDIVVAAFDRAKFDALAEKIAITAGHKIEGDPVKVVEVTAKKFGMSEVEEKSILQHLIEGADLTRYGLFNAITRTAEDLPDYDRASDFERFGGTIIELQKNDWQNISLAS